MITYKNLGQHTYCLIIWIFNNFVMVLCHASQINGILFYFNDTGQHKKLFQLPVKIQGDSYSFDISESEYDKQIALSPT